MSLSLERRFTIIDVKLYTN